VIQGVVIGASRRINFSVKTKVNDISPNIPAHHQGSCTKPYGDAISYEFQGCVTVMSVYSQISSSNTSWRSELNMWC